MNVLFIQQSTVRSLQTLNFCTKKREDNSLPHSLSMHFCFPVFVVEGNSRQQQYYSVSIDGAAGPLPDLVQSSLRYRAYSESAIYATQMTERVGASLRNMCDEFTLDHTRRRDNINLLVGSGKSFILVSTQIPSLL